MGQNTSAVYRYDMVTHFDCGGTARAAVFHETYDTRTRRSPPLPQWAVANWQQARPVILPLIDEAGRILTGLYRDHVYALCCIDTMAAGQALVPEIEPRLKGALAPYGLSANVITEQIRTSDDHYVIRHRIYINYNPGGPVALPQRMPQGLMPPGWTTAVDAQGRTYFIDHNTRTTTYNPPPPAPNGPPPPAAYTAQGHVPGGVAQASSDWQHGGAEAPAGQYEPPPTYSSEPPPTYSSTGQSSGVVSEQPCTTQRFMNEKQFKMTLAVLVVTVAAAATALPPMENMNGVYQVQNSENFNTNFSSYPALGRSNNTVRYVDVYSAEPIETIYSQVWWTMSTLAPFPDSLVKKFDDKVIAIVGYEFDQVMRDDDGTETPVPVTWSYNHHYSARVVGKYAEMYPIKVTGLDDPRVKGAGHLSPGSTVWAHRNVGDPRPNSSIPTIVDFDEANGGEWRKSFHGYPHGYAQLVDSPIGFRIEPMQIDTRSRDGSMRTAADGFHPDPTLVPKSYAAPLTGPDAVYSGLLECPCTDRISKVIDGQYNLQATGACPRRIVTVAECRKAIEKVGLPNGTRAITEGTDPTAPPGCSVVVRGDDLEEQKVFFNHLDSAASCGGKPSTNTGVVVAGVAQSLVSLQLDLTPAADNVTITVSGPADVWFGLAFGATEMAQQPVAVIVDGSGAVTEYQIGDHVGGSKVPTQVTVVSNTVVGNTRTVVLRRGLVGATPAHYTFNASAIGVPIPWMNAVGSSGTYAFHKDMSSSSVVLARLDTPLCVCGDEIEFGSAKGQVVYTHDDGSTEAIEHSGTSCTNTTPTDLIPTRNPRCDLTTYVGGLSCCHHQWLLTDREQRPRISNDTLKFWMKVRLWYQEYIPATPTAPASHELLVRMYHSIAGEYDVVKNPTGVQTNVFKFQVKDMLHPDSTRNDVWATGFPTPNQTGIKLMYINGHCHAAACITFDLYNDDTGELLCRQVGRMGSTLHPSRATRFDEKGYVRLYPCVFGTRGEGLPEPTLLTFNTTLRSVKITNATYTHYGEMAHWQARGVLA